MKLTVLGDGAWGTAIASLLAYNKYDVTLWCYNPAVAESIINKQENTLYMPGVKLSTCIKPCLDLNRALADSNLIFQAIPTAFLRSTLSKISFLKNHDKKATPWILLNKGIENKTLLLPTQILDSILPYHAPKIVLSGPSFACETINQQPTCIMLATQDSLLVEPLQNILHNNFFKTVYTHDTIGVQVGGALKNIITLALGILKAQKYSDNTISFVVTYGLQEISILAQALGGDQKTIYGLSGIGDLILTAFGSHSKNLQAGILLGSNKTLDEIKAHFATLPESFNTICSAYSITQKYALKAPLITTLYNIIYKNYHPKLLIDCILV